MIVARIGEHEKMNILILIAFVLFTSFAYNMTEEMVKEDRLLQACIMFNLQIDDCDQIYGSIPK